MLRKVTGSPAIGLGGFTGHTEIPDEVLAFLEREGLTLTDVLLDPSSRTMQEMETRGLPTTLFFDTQGQLLASHVGELTIASPKDAIGRHFGPSLQSGTDL